MPQLIKRFFLLACAMVFLAVPGAVIAVEPDEMLSDPKLEARAREVSKDLRCLVCQNQSIDDSHADLAKDLRVLVREFISKGLSNEQVTDEIVGRYGEFVLLKPRFSMHTLLLWFAPLVMLLFGGGYIYMNWNKRAIASSAPEKIEELSSEERKRLDKLMKAE